MSSSFSDRDFEDYNAFFQACSNGSLDKVDEYLRTHPVEKIKELGKLTGNEPLKNASLGGHLPVVTSLLASEAITKPNEEKDITSLMFACLAGHIEVVKILLNNGANPDAKSYSGYTALNFARTHRHQEITTFLESKYPSKPFSEDPSPGFSV